LGKNLALTGIISREPLKKAQEIMLEYRKICDEFEVDIVEAVATSAVREANNSQYVTKILEDAFNGFSDRFSDNISSFSNNNFLKDNNVFQNKKLKMKIKVISGETEAELCFKGASFGENLNTIIDIGGGSTEIITGKSGRIIDKISVPIGIVKLAEELNIYQPVSNYRQKKIIDEFLENQFSFLQKEHKHRGNIIAVSGTPTTLAQIAQHLTEYDDTKINNYVFTRKKFENVVEKVLNFELETLIKNYKLEHGRANVLSAGALILAKILNLLEKDTFLVSTEGLCYGLALKCFEYHYKVRIEAHKNIPQSHQTDEETFLNIEL
jgi:exopolyphosphatase/guanosine-5'-triphosphate,3'-diphosphate pyrophosphatase